MPENYPTKSLTGQTKRDLTGQRFARLTVLRYAGIHPKAKSRMWECACECGGNITTRGTSLIHGLTRSCGCLQREAVRALCAATTTHGESRAGQRSPEYECWERIKARCHRPSHHHYRHYGGRGIQVCDRWRNNFAAFLSDVGRRPGTEYSIDRIDVNGNYEPGNVRWATQTEQCRNRRDNRVITWNDQTHTLAEWAEITGMPYASIAYRLTAGWLPEYALTVPINTHIKGYESKLYRGQV